MLEEIVTVARKKSAAESVQDVPVAVTAFGAAQLDAQFVKKIEDLSYVMPNVQLESVGTFPGVQNFSIRGQGINSSIPSVDPTVGVFVDGLYMGTTYGVVIDTFDLESVEVLRGPQGLLFGRNVTGGAVGWSGGTSQCPPRWRIRCTGASRRNRYRTGQRCSRD
jgi:iron complex outermembrane receptor protein